MIIEQIIKNYSPMTETAFYILLSLSKPRHGYGIIKHVEEVTNNRLKLGSGTIYGTLTKMERDGIITMYADEKRKKIYEITDDGKTLMRHEMKRLNELYVNVAKYKGAFE
ncbi:PadR family transcriptional regulator [Viridibacillus arvi]|nr:PadR family transcriptional regulator [Viridibacillus arvi]